MNFGIRIIPKIDPGWKEKLGYTGESAIQDPSLHWQEEELAAAFIGANSDDDIDDDDSDDDSSCDDGIDDDSDDDEATVRHRDFVEDAVISASQADVTQ